MSLRSGGKTNQDQYKFTYPGGYYLEKIELFSFDDKSDKGIDIRDLVQKLTIEESIVSFGLLCKISIVDGVNLMEELQLSGNEKIKIAIRRKDPYQKLAKIDLTFIVAEYPLFGKGDTKRNQVYQINAVSEHIFMNGLTSLSKVVRGTPSKMIQDIMIKELLLKKDSFLSTEEFKNNYTYIIPNLRPLNAVRQILKMTADSSSAPILAWQTLQGFRVEGMTTIFKKLPYKNRTYALNQLPTYAGSTSDERYIQELTSILEMSSNLKMSKLEQCSNGAFASNMQHYDMSSKKYIEKKFDIIQKPIPRLSKEISYALDFMVNDKQLTKYYNAKDYNLLTTSDEKLLGNRLPFHTNVKESILAVQDNITHDLKLFGDLEFETGNVIKIEIPNSSPSQNSAKNIDEHLSGKYLVTSVKHEFVSDTYSMLVNVTKDGFDKKISLS